MGNISYNLYWYTCIYTESQITYNSNRYQNLHEFIKQIYKHTYPCNTLFRSLVYGIELILILIENLYLLGSYTYSRLILIWVLYLYHSDLILIADLFLFQSPIGHILILISRRAHNYSNSSYTVLNLYIYLDGGTYPHTHTSIYLILVPISCKIYRVYTCTEVLIHVLVLMSISDLP